MSTSSVTAGHDNAIEPCFSHGLSRTVGLRSESEVCYSANLYGRTNGLEEARMPSPRDRRPGISRRDFLRGTAGSAIALPSLAAILAACERPGADQGVDLDVLTPRPDSPVTLPMETNPIADDTPIEEGAELLLFNWDAYIWKPIVRRFAEKYADYNISFSSVTTFNNMDEAVAKLQAGQVEADVFFPTIDVVPRLAVAEMLQPLNHNLIPNLQNNVWGVYQNPYYDQEWRYTVPYVVYTTGIAYRRDVISDEEI
jgi:spermidine/putrescine transport system substrate-binding protein